MSKAAVDQLTRCAALDLAPKGVRVNAVNPGVVLTNLHRRSGMDETKYAEFLERSTTTHPLGRVGTPDEIAELIAFLLSPAAGWITGETVLIDGGRHLTCFAIRRETSLRRRLAARTKGKRKIVERPRNLLALFSFLSDQKQRTNVRTLLGPVVPDSEGTDSEGSISGEGSVSHFVPSK